MKNAKSNPKSDLRPHSPIASVQKIAEAVVSCDRCPRLLTYCKGIAQKKRKQFQSDTYWGKPVPSFGDAQAELLMVGLAPAAHGANRTGRMFTGDNSGLWLYRALHKAGFANQATSERAQDGLKLINAYITATIHCAPPDNQPLPDEILNCRSYFEAELKALTEVKVILVLGQIALKALWASLPDAAKPMRSVPKFKHGMKLMLANQVMLFASYHPSQQNTFTKRLTEPMFDQVFDEIRQYLNQ